MPAGEGSVDWFVVIVLNEVVEVINVPSVKQRKWLKIHATNILKQVEMRVDYVPKRVDYCFSRRNSVGEWSNSSENNRVKYLGSSNPTAYATSEMVIAVVVSKWRAWASRRARS